MKLENANKEVPAGIVDDRVLHQFLTGIKKDIRRFVLVRSPTDLASAIAAAQTEEASDLGTIATECDLHALSCLGCVDPTEAFALEHRSPVAPQTVPIQYNSAPHVLQVPQPQQQHMVQYQPPANQLAVPYAQAPQFFMAHQVPQPSPPVSPTISGREGRWLPWPGEG